MYPPEPLESPFVPLSATTPPGGVVGATSLPLSATTPPEGAVGAVSLSLFGRFISPVFLATVSLVSPPIKPAAANPTNPAPASLARSIPTSLFLILDMVLFTFEESFSGPSCLTPCELYLVPVELDPFAAASSFCCARFLLLFACPAPGSPLTSLPES